jgi:hypothetical protein
MPARTPARRHTASTIAAIERHHGQDDPRLPGLRRAARTARAEEYITRLLAETPPLSEENRAHLARLLTHPTAGGAE